MTHSSIEVITSVQRRRRWSEAEKRQIVVASLETGASVSELARKAGVHPSQIYGWRRQLGVRASAPDTFAAVSIASEAGLAASAVGPSGVIEIELGSGTRLRISGVIDAGTLSVTLDAVVRSPQPR